MLRLDDHPSGRHFLQIPGPTNVPDRVLRAIDQPTIDHRGPEFGRLTLEILDRLKQIFRTESPVIIYTASGTGAWEAALVNTLSPGDRVLMFETGHFATLWRKIAEKLGLVVDFVAGDWRSGVDTAVVESRLGEDKGYAVKAVLVVHNETSTGVTSRIAAIRQAIDRAGHPALFMVDTISGLGSLDYRHADWGVDVTVAGSQKGLMLPPGLSFNAVSDKALAANKSSRLPKAYWPGTKSSRPIAKVFSLPPATSMLYGLHEATAMLLEEGLDCILARHDRHAKRRAARSGSVWTYLPQPGRVQQCAHHGTMPRRPRRRCLAPRDPRAVRHVAWHGLGKVTGRVRASVIWVTSTT
jgi:alanine-glyoxylate transaminase/serine-glyoxylate transaminase/serine-pyruvate transaminase